MSKYLKFFSGMAIFGIWGPYLVLVWLGKVAVPHWAMGPGTRRALMLSRDYDTTFFTLLFGLMFTGILLFGLVSALRGKGPLFEN